MKRCRGFGLDLYEPAHSWMLEGAALTLAAIATAVLVYFRRHPYSGRTTAPPASAETPPQSAPGPTPDQDGVYRRPEGRPPLYKPEYCDMARLLCAKGAIDQDLNAPAATR